VTFTAEWRQRAFLVETMGRDCGYLALMTEIAGGAEAIVIPEVETDPELVAAELRGAYDRGKAHAIAVVAEGAEYNAEKLTRYFKRRRERFGFDLRVTILGHIQPRPERRMLRTKWIFNARAKKNPTANIMPAQVSPFRDDQ
jgi:6-phosphofructokinase 1